MLSRTHPSHLFDIILSAHRKSCHASRFDLFGADYSRYHAYFLLMSPLLLQEDPPSVSMEVTSCFSTGNGCKYSETKNILRFVLCYWIIRFVSTWFTTISWAKTWASRICDTNGERFFSNYWESVFSILMSFLTSQDIAFFRLLFLRIEVIEEDVGSVRTVQF